MAKVRKDLKSREYQANRRRFLDEWDGPCHWCKRAKAVEVDHIIPVAAGIDPTEQGNWVGSCKKCNARRGAEHLARTRAQRVAARSKAVKHPPEFFEQEATLTPTPIFCISENGLDKPEPDGADQIAPDLAAGEQIQPRLVTPMLGGLSYGDQVAAVAKDLLGVELMPWQRMALNGQLEHDEAGNLVRRRSLVSVARQNGKTMALKAMILWALTKEPERRGESIMVISTAHQLDLAVEIFEAIAPILGKEFGAKVKWSYGRNEAIMPDGTRWLVQAATPKAFHGFSPTYIIADEVWNISRDVLLNGALPSQRVMKSPLLSCWSTAGTEDSHAMLQMREEGLRAIDEGRDTKLYMAEWSVPPGIDPMQSPDLWKMANPAIGYTLEPDVLRDESEQVDKAAFLRASLNIWISSERSWLPPGTFDALKVDDIPAGGVLAVDSSIDDSLYCGVRAQRVGDDQIGVTVEFLSDSLASCWENIAAADASCDKIALTPSLFDLAPTQFDFKKVQVGTSEIYTHTGTIRQLITEGRIVHTGEQMLAEHVSRAVGVKSPRGYTLSSQKSSGPITLARCMIFAAALVARPSSRQKPAIAFSG
ncbi:MAG: HNH endonuclease [Steroidobacteraceae bacterium]